MPQAPNPSCNRTPIANPRRPARKKPQELERYLASNDGRIFSTVAKLVEALKRSIPEGSENAERKKGSAAPREGAAARDQV
jgi:hypothetical protein